MAKTRIRASDRLLTIGLVVGGLCLVVLLIALGLRFMQPRTVPLRAANPAGLVGDIIQVEVRNGCGVSGLAADMTRYLRDQGFDVVEVGDYKTFDQARSFVIDRAGDMEAARRVAAAIGLPPERVRQEIDADLYLDASVVIGSDYADLKPFGKD